MNRKGNNRGTALLFALILLVILGSGTSLLWKQLHQGLQQHRVAWHQEVAYQLAEAGLDTAVAMLRAGDWTEGQAINGRLEAGVFTVAVTEGDEAGLYRLRATGRRDNAAYHYDEVVLIARVTVDARGRVSEYAMQRARKGETL